MYKALLVDDDGIERQGMAALTVFPRCAVQIVAEASNGQQALELAEKLKCGLLSGSGCCATYC